MAYRVEFLPAAARDMKRLPADVAPKVMRLIESLAANPRPPGCKALAGSLAGLLRVRIGTYRVLYQVRDARLLVLVVRALHRRDAYR